MAARRLTLVGLASLCALAGLLALVGVSAQAAVTHEYLSQITKFPPKDRKAKSCQSPAPSKGSIR